VFAFVMPLEPRLGRLNGVSVAPPGLKRRR
jgi:hypothetical protein